MRAIILLLKFIKELFYMKTYTIIAGVNGCGKSSLTGVLRTEINKLSKLVFLLSSHNLGTNALI